MPTGDLKSVHSKLVHDVSYLEMGRCTGRSGDQTSLFAIYASGKWVLLLYPAYFCERWKDILSWFQHTLKNIEHCPLCILFAYIV